MIISSIRRALSLGLLAVALSSAAVAQTVSAPGAVDFNPLLRAVLDYAVPLVLTPIALALTALFVKVANAVGYNLDDAKRARLQEIIESGVAYGARLALEKAPNLPAVQLRSAVLTNAAEYVVKHGSETIRALGGNPADEASIHEIIQGRAAAALDAVAPKPA